MTKRQKLELTWVGKENRPRLEPRVLIEDAEKSYHAAARISDADIFDNILIHGDNLLALKALEQDFAGKVKCVFIDPPYNTGSAFEHYDDGLAHSIWLGLMRDRLELLKRLLMEDGSLWITIDDNEAHYLKVVCDEIFGRTNFVASVVWQKRTAPDARLSLGDAHDNILVFAKNREALRFNSLPQSAQQLKNYRNPDNDPRGPWASSDFSAKGFRPNQVYEIVTPGGARYTPPEGKCWQNIEDTYLTQLADNRFWFGKDGMGVPRRKTFLNESPGVAAWTWWPNTEVGHNQEAKKEIIELFSANNVFDTPKPERLMKRVMEIASIPGDLVLDSFAGSGTTGAVAHKMGRRWIMVELGDHCFTHIVPRLKKVIDGVDPGGVTASVDWKGGGGYRYHELAPSLLQKDKWGREVISKRYNAEMLAQALCKLEGFTYDPSPYVYWQQGHSSEADFLYVTTQMLAPNELVALSDEVGDGRSLLVLCSAFRGDLDHWPNLTLRKIPNYVRSRCEWGHDDYSLNVANLPMSKPEATRPKQAGLFDDGDET